MYFSVDCQVVDVFLSHEIYLRMLAIAGKPVPVWSTLIIFSLKKIPEHVLNFEIPQIVFLLKKIITVHKTRFVSQNIIRKIAQSDD